MQSKKRYIALEAYTNDPVIIKVKENKLYEQNKVLLYSKVVGAQVLAKQVKLPFNADPWLHCINVKSNNSVLAYIWDSREIVAVHTDSAINKAFEKFDLSECIRDKYDGFNKSKPILTNPNKFKEAMPAMLHAKKWIQPWIHIALYQKMGNETYEFDILTNTPELGQDILLGTYVFSKGKSVVDIDPALLVDIYPAVSKKDAKNFQHSQSGSMTFQEIQNVLIEGLSKVTI